MFLAAQRNAIQDDTNICIDRAIDTPAATAIDTDTEAVSATDTATRLYRRSRGSLIILPFRYGLWKSINEPREQITGQASKG